MSVFGSGPGPGAPAAASVVANLNDPSQPSGAYQRMSDRLAMIHTLSALLRRRLRLCKMRFNPAARLHTKEVSKLELWIGVAGLVVSLVGLYFAGS